MTKPEGGYQVRLTPQAEADLEGIWLYTARMWSIDQANNYIEGLVAKFDLLARSPFTARERTEFKPPVRVHVHQSHVVIYRLSDIYLQVIRVAHMKQNWATLLA